MLIDGPLKITVSDDGGMRQLVLEFANVFQMLSPEQQGKVFADYVQRLARSLAALDENDVNRQGMMLIHRVAEQLLPHIQAGEVPLEETILVQIEQGLSLGQLLDSSSH